MSATRSRPELLRERLAAARLYLVCDSAAGEGDLALLPTDIAAHLGDAVLELTARRRVKRSSENG